MIEWEYQWGTDKVPLTVDSVVYALDTAKSLIQKEISFNDKVRDSAKFKEDYERKLLILTCMRDNFVQLWEDHDKEIVHPMIPGRRKK
jgi:Iap family predicted aminopeptidase